MEDLYTEQGFDANQISIVLVNTSHPGNIGAAARGMKNMGLKKLVLVKESRPIRRPTIRIQLNFLWEVHVLARAQSTR